MTEDSPAAVIVIDDDDGVREALCRLFRSVGLAATSHGSVQAFLAVDPPDAPACIVLDIRLPGRSGLEFLEALPRGRLPLPIVMISAHVDVPMAVRAMKAGAVDVLSKPVREQELLEAVNRAIESDRRHRGETRALVRLQARFATLSERERQVMALVVAGRLNKQIAAEVDLAEATVKAHRGQAMRKMQATTLPELVRMADQLRARRDEI